MNVPDKLLTKLGSFLIRHRCDANFARYASTQAKVIQGNINLTGDLLSSQY